MSQLARTELLILDDWRLEPLQGVARHDQLEIMDDRRASTSVVSQLRFDQWYATVTTPWPTRSSTSSRTTRLYRSFAIRCH